MPLPNLSEAEDSSESSILQSVPSGSVSSEVYQKRIHNSSLPVSKLPAELLANIFELPCSSYYPRLDKAFVQWEDFRKMRLSRSSIINTCFHWRKVGLATSLLWSKLYFCTRWRGVHPFTVEYLSLEVERARHH